MQTIDRQCVHEVEAGASRLTADTGNTEELKCEAR